MQSTIDRRLDRPNLSDTVVETVRRMIVEGQLAAGARINEVRLAAQLGVSRTPLREALGRLVAEGALIAAPRKGWFVAPLTAEELAQLYDIRPILDPEALRLAGLPSGKTLARLESINRLMQAETDPERVIGLDDLWHLVLLSGCPNRVLVGMIEQVMLRTRRYELALMRERPAVERAVDHHEAIVSAIRRGDLDGACAALKQNMQHGREPILAWLRERERPGGVSQE